MKNIETLARKLDLYKGKTQLDIEKKLNTIESKFKQEATQLKQDCINLQEITGLKDQKIDAMQQEIDRLKHILPQSSKPEGITEAKGEKLEYKIVVPSESSTNSLKKEKELEKILNMHTGSMAKTIIAQGKVLDEYVQEVESIRKQEPSNKLAEVVQEKEMLTREINRLFEKINKLTENLKAIIRITEAEFEKVPQLKNCEALSFLVYIKKFNFLC